ncbi:ATP-binding cassette domain-containing protein [Mesoterricola silvestris]|uniref:ABC transporter ATP-binding protein n=1 Tax=Mesoterricola silvestris TaxID=2927979 RepID=A0AA48GL51_9BACT|nr:ATP-binding cassette domain-containing protein [Mesoterricola silvestris]BDU73392.1 ABC transporter ATP-binding protein [Mesoterricola silvestris]
MPRPLLALEGVSLASPEGRVVFQDLDWKLDRGARWHLQGNQGTGATALLRLCAGLARPREGRVVLDGREIDLDALDHPFINAGDLGWVPTDGGLAVNLTLLDNVALPLRFSRKVGREEAREEALRWLERAGLGRSAASRPRLPADRACWMTALARAGAKGSRLWLVDRPAGGLDPESRKAAHAILEEAARDPETTLVLVGGDWMEDLGAGLRIEDGRLATGSAP